jgi:hypothetical protein
VVLKCLGGVGTPSLSPSKRLGFIKNSLFYVPTIIVDVVIAEMKQLVIMIDNLLQRTGQKAIMHSSLILVMLADASTHPPHIVHPIPAAARNLRWAGIGD